MSVDERPVIDEEEPAAPPLPPPTTELLFSAGQSAWLALVTVGVLIAIGLSIAALVVASSDEDGGGGGAAAPTGPATAVDVEAREFAFDPEDVTIVADTDVPVTLDNVGAVDHNWTVLEAGTTIRSESDFDEGMVAAQVVAGPGSSDTGSVNLPAGSYQVICTVAGHFSAGMAGTLEVAA